MVDSAHTPGTRLERYTEKCLQEVLLVVIEVDGEADQIAVFRGFSSSLVRSTAFESGSARATQWRCDLSDRSTP